MFITEKQSWNPALNSGDSFTSVDVRICGATKLDPRGQKCMFGVGDGDNAGAEQEIHGRGAGICASSLDKRKKCYVGGSWEASKVGAIRHEALSTGERMVQYEETEEEIQ